MWAENELMGDKSIMILKLFTVVKCKTEIESQCRRNIDYSPESMENQTRGKEVELEYYIRMK